MKDVALMNKKSVRELSEAEIDARIAKYESRPTSHQRAGGAEPGFAWLVTICGAIGVWAAISLLVAEKQKLLHPDSVLPCDINPLVGCGKWVGTWQNEVFFGVSNSVYGLAFFAGIVALGLALVSGARFARWLWCVLAAALSAGMLWIAWFMYESFAVEGSLCPYCLVTWFVTITLFAHTISRVAQSGHFGDKTADAGRALARNRWLGAGVGYAVIILLIVVTFWEQLPLFFV